jgi:hypothetical protein
MYLALHPTAVMVLVAALSNNYLLPHLALNQAGNCCIATYALPFLKKYCGEYFIHKQPLLNIFASRQSL